MKRLILLLVTIAAIVMALISSGNSALAASSLVNGNFETGDLTGWSVDATNGGNASAVTGYGYLTCEEDGVCGHPQDLSAEEGSYFALLSSGIQQSAAPSISQPFEASNGDKVSGWVFVNTDSFFDFSGDKAQVVIKSDSGTTVATPYEGILTVGGHTYWHYWEYTFSGVTGAGKFQIEAQIQNTGTIEDHSVMGLDDVKTTTASDNDTTAPDTSITSGPNGPTNNTAPTFSFSGSDNVTSTANLKYQYRLDSGGWSAASTSTTANLTGLSEGAHLFEVRAVDEAGNVDGSSAQRSFTVDTTAPKVDSVIPKEDTTGVDRTTNVMATFAEKMRDTSINGTTFKLFKKGSTTQIAATVSYDPMTRTATLNPFGSTTTRLARGTTYKAVVTTGAKDLAGTSLDQNPSLDGLQPKKWFFTTTP